MIADRNNEVRVRANIPGWVEVLVKPGQQVGRGDCLCEVEGEGTLERLAARAPSVVVQVHVENDTQVEQAALLMTLRELPKED
ncbi:MAG: biotin/lipoyl-containing protein [Myxococcota bacterium]|nr:biotin/lipoyl-containing protein [Myxococcota bacterium]